MSPQPEWLFSRDPYYWRGPIWAPTTYLMFRGLQNYGFTKKAEEIVYKWVSLIRDAGDFYEYYFNDGRPGKTKLSSFGWTATVTIKLLVDSGLMSEKDIYELRKDT
jgi:neutral trehalase